MHLKFKNKRITGILSVLPEIEVDFYDEILNYNFSEKQSLKLGKIMGYGTRRIVSDSTTTSDLCVYGMKYLFDNNLLDKNTIDAIVLCTQSPDQLIPATSSIISGRLSLSEDVICMDINQGCAGFEFGLLQAFMLLNTGSISRVVLINADILSRKVSTKDRNSRPLVGDGASITIVENHFDEQDIDVFIKMDGTSALSIQIPAGGFKMQSNIQTSMQVEDDAGNFRSLDNLVMKGDEVFNFVQSKVPEMVNEMLLKLNLDKSYFDYYLFHQPNKFMLNKLADKIGVDRAKMPANIVENFGNASGATIAINMAFNIS